MDSDSLQKIRIKLLFLESNMTLYPVTIQRKLRRWYNAVTEIDVSVDPECFGGGFPKEVKSLVIIWNRWNDFRGHTDAKSKVKDV